MDVIFLSIEDSYYVDNTDCGNVCFVALWFMCFLGAIHILYNAKRGGKGLAMCYFCYMGGGGGLNWRYIT